MNDVDILVVEDSSTQALQLQLILERQDYHVSRAVNGREALTLLRQHKPTLVISDIVMPEMDGYELCRQIRADQHLKDLPVILLTSLSNPKDVIRGLACGANNFVTKPFDEQHLLYRIQNVLVNHELRKEMKAEMGISVFFAGEQHFITAERMQILDLLLSTYEAAVQQNGELIRVQEELRELNEQLEEKVEERTCALIAEMAERKRAEEKLLRSQKMEAVGRLAGGIAHDFNNLLTIINGYSHFLLDCMDQDDPKRIDVQEIKKAGDRAAALTRQLLAFSRHQVAERRVLNLNEVVVNLETMLRRLIGEDIELAVLPAEDLCLISADPGQMEQIIVNLAVNARDAMPRGGQLKIETANEVVGVNDAIDFGEMLPGPYVKLTVTDTGAGMSQEVQSKVFDPFFTTKEQGKGTGLGLSVVQGIVQQSKGCIEVRSEEGRGSTFQILLPRVEDMEEAGTGSAVQGEPLGGTETVLVVEDDDAIRQVAVRTLAGLGYTVLAAPNGSEALGICEEDVGAIQLLLTDVVMPGMNGRELAERLTVRSSDLKVIYMSGYTDDSMLRAGVLAEKVPFLQKPFTAQRLASKIRTVLDG